METQASIPLGPQRVAPAALLALALASALAFGTDPAAAQGLLSVTLYGLADAGVEITNAGKGSVKRLLSGGMQGSRWGLRGSEDLGGGWSASFRLEAGINIDDGTLGQGGRAFGREAFVGIGSRSMGTVQLGRVYLPYYTAQSVVDAFVWGTSGGMLALTRSGPTTQQVAPLLVNARADNSLNFVSPSWGGLVVRAQVAAGEGSLTIGRLHGASLRYQANRLDVASGYAIQKGRDNANGEIRALTAGGSYDFGPARVYIGYTEEKNSCSTCTGALGRATGVSGGNASQFRLVNVGVRVPVGSATAIAQVVRVADRSAYAVNPGERDATWVALGGDYSLSKRTTLYAAVASIGNQNGSLYVLGTGSAQQPALSVGPDNPRSTTASLGVRHVF